jgi:hypothetical protein
MHHDRSMAFASQAQMLGWQGKLKAAKGFYAIAAAVAV